MNVAGIELAQNDHAVLPVIRRNPGIDRGTLAKTAGMSVTALQRVVRRLGKTGAIDTGQGQSTGGRRPITYRLNPSYLYSGGVDFGTDVTRIVLLDFAGTIVAAQEFEPETGVAYRSELERAARALEQCRADHGIAESLIAGVGIAVAGVVDTRQGTCVFKPRSPDWSGVRLSGDMQLLVPGSHVTITDRVRAITRAEMADGSLRGTANGVLVNIAYGIGGGLVFDGTLYEGSQGIAGEIGHIPTATQGRLCVCGNSDCLESYASARALEEICYEGLRRGVLSSLAMPAEGSRVPLRTILEAAAGGDKFAAQLIEDAGEHLAVATATIANILCPEVIVLTGGLIRGTEKAFVETIARKARSRILPWLRRSLAIRRGRKDAYAGATGAALRVFHELRM